MTDLDTLEGPGQDLVRMEDTRAPDTPSSPTVPSFYGVSMKSESVRFGLETITT